MIATLAIDAKSGIGECPVWDAIRNRLIWSDNELGIIYEGRADGSGGWRETRRWSFGKPLAAVIPRREGGFAVTSGNEVTLLDESGKSRVFASLDFDTKRQRFGDAKCDPTGRLWVNTFSHDFSPSGCVYRVDLDGSWRQVLDSALLSNGMEWSRDGSVFYFADSARLTVDGFDCDLGRGEIRNRRTIVTIERGGGCPNGVVVDDDGCLWIALTGGGEVRRYGLDGHVLNLVAIGHPGATSCAFGGDRGGDLFITSRSGRLPAIAAAVGVRPEMMECEGPAAGGLFVCQPGVTGRPATLFVG